MTSTLAATRTAPSGSPDNAIIPTESADAFAAHGFVHDPAFLPNSAVAGLAAHALPLAIHHCGDGPPHAGIQTALGHTLQLRNTWQFDDQLRRKVFNLQLARRAALLLGSGGVQLYSDLLIVKEPGAPESLWHIDAAHMPVAAEAVVVAYIPLSAHEPAGHSLEILSGSHVLPECREFKLHRAAALRRVRSRLRRCGLPVIDVTAAPGDVVFMSGNTFHRLRGNATNRPATSLWIYYFAAGQTLSRPKNPFQALERGMHFPDVPVGRPIFTPTTPLVWGATRRGDQGRGNQRC